MPNESTSPKPRRFWPGMPTRGTQFVESLFMMFPACIAIIGISLVILLGMVQSCRDLARDHAGQAPPLHAEQVSRL